MFLCFIDVDTTVRVQPSTIALKVTTEGTIIIYMYLILPNFDYLSMFVPYSLN